MSDIEKDLEKQINDTVSAIESGALTPEEGKMILEEIEKAMDALGLAQKEILVRNIVKGITLAKSLL